MKKLIPVLFMLLASILLAENLTIEDIFQHPRIWGTSPTNPVWSHNGKLLAFLWNEKGERFRDLYVYNTQNNRLMRITDFKSLPADRLEDDQRTKEEKEEERLLDRGISDLVWFPDDRHILVEYKGDFYRCDPTGAESPKPFIKSRFSERSPEFSPDGRYLLFTRDHNVWIHQMAGGAEIQVTREGTSQKPVAETYYLGYLKEEDLSSWSPDSKKIAIVQYNLEGLTELAIPDYLKDKVTCQKQVRPRAGEKLASTRIGVVWIDSLYQIPTWLQLPEKNEFYLRSLKWSPDAARLAFEIVDKSQKKRYILLGEIKSGKVDTIYQESDTCWIGDLGGELFWIKNGTRLLFGSEKNGWNHLYELEYTTGLDFPLTHGRWEVHDYFVNPGSNLVFFTSNREDYRLNHLYRLNLKTEKIKQVTYLDGWYSFRLSGDDRSLALLYSSNSQPNDLFWSKSKPRSRMNRITTSPLPEFSKIKISPPEYRTYDDLVDGKRIHARIWTPPGVMAGEKYPLIVYVHGAGYAQSNRNSWRLFNLWHQYLSEKGYVVVDIDYRGSSGYGRDWRVDVYRYLGNKDLADLVSVIKQLPEDYNFIDMERIGIWGWSYGGFLTLTALFKEPEIFKVGVSVAGVTDWEKYNLWYTTQRFNYPQNDSLAYYQSSPINFVTGLKGKLLIVHGMKDSNVHFQDAVLLMDRLIKAGKDFDLLLYPRENHGFSRDESLIHLFRKIQEYFDTNLKSGTVN